MNAGVSRADMGKPDTSWRPPQHEGKCFSTTRWALVVLAADADSEEAARALEDLCRDYWYPLYAHVRRRGYSAEDAQDLTQEFFARILEKRYLKLADPQRGRFRTFLLASLNNFLVNEWRKGQTAKRKIPHGFLALDEEDAESRYLAEPANGLTPDKLYDRRWAVALVDRVLRLIQDEYAAVGKAAIFEMLKPQLLGDASDESYRVLAQRLHMSEGAFRVTALRLRERYRELLRAEVARTVAAPAEVDEELRHLIGVLRG